MRAACGGNWTTRSEVMPNAPGAPWIEGAYDQIALADQDTVDLAQQFVRTRRMLERVR